MLGAPPRPLHTLRHRGPGRGAGGDAGAGAVPAGRGELPQAGRVLLPGRRASGRRRGAGPAPGGRARVRAWLCGRCRCRHDPVRSARGLGPDLGPGPAPRSPGLGRRHAPLRHPG